MKIKLVAIAKDECAYLAEWIFHHFEFGFDAIDIYINGTTDESLNLLKSIRNKYPINIIEADELLSKAGKRFQVSAYEDAYYRTSKENYTHIFFLDIDEFWTPKNFKTGIKEFIKYLGNPDVISFEWCVPSDEQNLFRKPFLKSNKYLKNYHVKSLLKITDRLEQINIHNSYIKNGDYRLADGSKLVSDLKHKYRVDEKDERGPIKDAFVLHRVTRSPIEYVSLLGRGRPSEALKIKDNRWGHITSTPNEKEFNVCEKRLTEYYLRYNQFLELLDLCEIIGSAREFVLDRYKKVVSRIPFIEGGNETTLNKVLKNVELPSVTLSHELYLKMQGKNFDFHTVNDMLARFYQEKSTQRKSEEFMLFICNTVIESLINKDVLLAILKNDFIDD